MKQIGILFICLAFVLTASTAYTQPVGNIATPSVLKKGLVMQSENGQYGIILASEDDVTFDRNLEKQDGDSEFVFWGGKAGVLLMDRFIAYGILGVGKADQTFTISGAKVLWQTDYDLVWGAGGTAMLYETKLEQLGNGILRIGADGRYRRAGLDVDKVGLSNVSGLSDVKYTLPNASVTDTKFEFGEWQIALAVSYQIDQFIPYVGGKYSDITDEAKTTINGTQYKVDFENDNNFGVFVGGDWLVNDSIIIGAEGRFIDETALTASATVRF